MHRGLDVSEFAHEAGRIIKRGLPFDGFCLLTLDPATMLPTSEVVDNGLPGPAMRQMADIEVRGDDYNAFSAMVRAGQRAASLSAATEGELDRSLRHRELRAPNGFGDELRVVLLDDGTAWGAYTLLRGDDHRQFDTAQTDLLASVSGVLAVGLRRAMLLTDRAAEEAHEADEVGVVLLDSTNAIVHADALSQRWLHRLRCDSSDGLVPSVVSSVASRARSIAEGRSDADAVARARVRTKEGQWLVVRGSVLGTGTDARTAVMLQPARPRDVAPLVADALGLTPRERAVTQLVARGFSTDAIACRLYLSPWTVQDHLKSIFEKVGVTTRGELVARLFFDDREPRLSDPGRDGAT